MQENNFRPIFWGIFRTFTVVALLIAISQFLIGGCFPSGSWGESKRVYVTATDPTASEAGDTGEFSIRLTEAPSASLTVTYTVSGTATPDADYFTLPGSVTFAAGQTSATVTVTPKDDADVEADETVRITLGVVPDYDTSTNPATVTITSDDVTTVSIDATTDTTIEGSSSPGVFTVNLTTPTQGMTVYYTVSGTATPDFDYEALTGEVVIPSGFTAVSFSVNPLDYDTIVESTETVIVTLSPDAAYTVGATDTATVSIIDNDAPIASITSSVSDATESVKQGEFTITLSYDPGVDTTVNIALTGSAKNTEDYTTIGSTVVVPTGGAASESPISQTIIVDAPDDGLVEGFETVVATIGPTGGDEYVVGVPNSATVTIESVDKPEVIISATPASIAEATQESGTFTISINPAVAIDSALEVYYSVSGTALGGTTSPADYDNTGLATFATIPAGSTSVDITVSAFLDYNDSEPDETINLNLSQGIEYSRGTPLDATITITDYVLPEATLKATIPIAEEDPSTPTSGEFTVSLGTPSVVPLTIPYEIVAASTALEGSDFNALAGTIDIPASTTADFTISIDPIFDSLIEGNETVILTLTQPTNGQYKVGTQNTDTVTIQSAEKPVVIITAAPILLNEGTQDSGTITISIDPADSIDSALEVSYTVGGSAEAGTDFDNSQLTGSAAIIAGNTSVDIPISAIRDYLVEGDENVIISLTAGGEYILGALADVTITIADYTVPIATISASNPIATEAGPVSGEFTITLATAPGEDLTIAYQLLGSSTAIEGADFTTLSGTLVITAGNTTGTISVDPIDDPDFEVNETVEVMLSTPGDNSYTVGAQDTATVTIQSDDI